MPLDELAEGGRVAVPNQLDQLAVGHPVANRRRYLGHCWVF